MCVSGPFSLATDGGSDKAVEFTLYPLVVTYYSHAHQQMRTAMLSVPSLDDAGTGKNIAKLVLDELHTLGITDEVFAKNCIAIATDNAAVMVGTKEGLLGQLRQIHPNLHSVGCACHLINLAAERAADALPVRVDELLTDIFYYLEKSKKRKQSLKSFQDDSAQKILKHVCTRWLSLGTCLQRLISNWTALLNFFEEEIKNQPKPKPKNPRLSSFTIPKKVDGEPKKRPMDDQESLPPQKKTKPAASHKFSEDKTLMKTSARSSKTTEGAATAMKKQVARDPPDCASKSPEIRQVRIYGQLLDTRNLANASFLKAVVPVFEKYNKLLQSEKPLIHQLLPILRDLYQTLLRKFIKVSVLTEAQQCPFSIDIMNEQNHKEEQDLFIGVAASAIVDTLTEEQKGPFYSAVKAYYIAACSYMLEKFPLRRMIGSAQESANLSRGDLLHHIQVADTATAANHSWKDLQFFLTKFPSLVLLKEGESLEDATDQLQQQWLGFQQHTIEAAICEEEREDVKWAKLSELKGVGGCLLFDRLAHFMLGLLSVPHSNAACERLFSQVRKNKTDFRGSLSSQTLNAMMVAKANMVGLCHAQKPTQDLLQKAKSATAQSLKSAAACTSNATAQ